MIDHNEIAKFSVSCYKSMHLQSIYKKLVQSVQYVYAAGVEGDIAEFGTMKGRTAVAISVAVKLGNLEYSSRPSESRGNKKAWFFDSFEGLPEARFKVDQDAPHVKDGIWAKGTCKGLNEEQFEKLIGQILPNEQFEVRKGFFNETVKLIEETQKFSFLHIDSDLYESAIDIFNSLLSRKMVASGAIILFDDWDCNHANPNLGERRAWSEMVRKYNISFSDNGHYSHMCKSFIIHSYG